MGKIRENRRNALKFKAMRQHKVDIWDTLAEKPRINRVTKRIFYEYTRRLKKLIFELKDKLATDAGFRLLKILNVSRLGKLRHWGRNLPRLPAKMVEKKRRRQYHVLGGVRIIQRKLISLYLSAGRNSRLTHLSNVARKGRFFSRLFQYPNKDVVPGPFREYSYREDFVPALMERRVTTLLARAHFVPSYQGRQWCQHGKVLVGGEKVKQPDQIVKNMIPITLTFQYRIRRKKELTKLFSRKGTVRFTTFPPTSYMYVDYITLVIYCYKATTDNVSTHMYNARISNSFSGIAK